MRAFAEAWPDREFVQAVLAQLPWYHQLALLRGASISSMAFTRSGVLIMRHIAEFHGARFLSNLPDETAEKVYDMLLNSHLWHD